MSIHRPAQQGRSSARAPHRRGAMPEGAGSEDGPYAEFVRSAYHQSDLDTVRVIRMIAASGGLQQ